MAQQLHLTSSPRASRRWRPSDASNAASPTSSTDNSPMTPRQPHTSPLDIEGSQKRTFTARGAKTCPQRAVLPSRHYPPPPPDTSSRTSANRASTTKLPSRIPRSVSVPILLVLPPEVRPSAQRSRAGSCPPRGPARAAARTEITNRQEETPPPLASEQCLDHRPMTQLPHLTSCACRRRSAIRAMMAPAPQSLAHVHYPVPHLGPVPAAHGQPSGRSPTRASI